MIALAGINSIAVARVVGLSILVGLLSGCLEKRIQWSPDGTVAAVITADGLFLANTSGELVSISSPVTVYAMAWLSDSHQMIVTGRTADDEPWLGLAKITNSQLIMGPRIHATDRIVDIRVAPGDRTFAFTVETEALEFLDLYVAPMNGSHPPALLSARAAAYPDWNADGRELFYMEAATGVSGEERLRLGYLLERQLLDDDGAFTLDEPSISVAGLAFETYSRIRCLADGGVIFNANQLELPYSAADFGARQQLFKVATNRHPTLVRLIPRSQRHRLPEHLSFFEVSPDETEILFGTTAGEVCHLTLATGAVRVIQAAATAEMKVAPVWRAPGEYTYVRIPESEANDLRTAAVVLQRDGESRVLSAEWPADLLDALMAD